MGRNHTSNDLPQSHIRKLDEGSEASFLVLPGNPLEKFDQLTNISLRVKQGQLIHL